MIVGSRSRGGGCDHSDPVVRLAYAGIIRWSNDDRSGASTCPRLEADLQPGAYVVLVEGFSGDLPETVLKVRVE
ncbi:MAG: hypothetical protein R3F60_04640 [bacterium]